MRCAFKRRRARKGIVIPMKNHLLHTPEGVRDIYNGECEKKIVLEERLRQVLRSYGYRPIQTPTFEFFDIFGKEIGTTPSKDLYKFFDREGNTLVLRPDLTPSIARAAVKYFMDEDMPIRLSYIGNTFVNNNSYQGRLKESTQLGAELIGDASADADAEMIAMVTDCLRAAGLKEFQIGIGHAGFFQGLAEAAGADEEAEATLRNLISNKNFFGVEEYVETLSVKEELRELFSMLKNPDLGRDELTRAEMLSQNYPKIHAAVRSLSDLLEAAKHYGISDYLSIEPGIISSYRYYTGIVFSGYTFGSGEAVVKGGRYDSLLAYFGKKSASVGFAVVVDQLMAALSRQEIEIPLPENGTLILYTSSNREKAVSEAKKRRAAGGIVELAVKDAAKSEEDYAVYAAEKHMTELLIMED